MKLVFMLVLAASLLSACAAAVPIASAVVGAVASYCAAMSEQCVPADFSKPKEE